MSRLHYAIGGRGARISGAVGGGTFPEGDFHPVRYQGPALFSSSRCTERHRG